MIHTKPLHDGLSLDPAAQNHQKNPSSRNAAVSARKLAASLWERQEIPLYQAQAQAPMANKIPSMPHHQFHIHSNGKQSSHLPYSSSPSSSVSRRMHRRVSIEHKLAEKARRYNLSIKQAGVAPKQNTPPSDIQGQTYNAAMSPSKSAVNLKGLPTDLGDGPRTSSELLNVLNRIWNLEEQNTSSNSLVSTLREELYNAHAKMQDLMHVQKLYHKEVDSLTKRLADERVMWQEQEQEKVRMAVHPIQLELEEERKTKKSLEALYRRVVQELTEMKATLGKTLQELERERKARELMEEICDELTREIGKDKAEVAELKRQSAKVREEVEEERKMLEMADIWREERVHMKLSEARLELEEKNTAVDTLRSELKSFLTAKRVCDARGEGNCSMDKKVERHRISVDSVNLHEARIAARNADAGYSEARNPAQSLAEPFNLGQVGSAAPAVQLYDDELSADDDLHSIDPYADNFISNTGTNPGSLFQHQAEDKSRNYADQRISIDKGRMPECGNTQGLEKARNHHLNPGITVVENKGKNEQLDCSTDSQWIDRPLERGEMREWSQDRQFLGIANNAVNDSRESREEGPEDRIIFDARTFGRHFQGHSLRPEADATPDSHMHNYISRGRDVGSKRISHANSGLAPMWQPLNVPSSPTRQWNHYWSSPDNASPLQRTAKEATTMSKVARDTSLKAKLLEARLEGQQVRIKAAKGLQ